MTGQFDESDPRNWVPSSTNVFLSPAAGATLFVSLILASSS
jgi:hypothetical protein